MAFDAGAIVGKVNLETGEFTANLTGAISKTNDMTKSMLGAQIQFALLEKAIGAVTGLLKNSLASWTKQEDAMAQTEARLKSTGNAAGLTAEEIYGLSTAMQEQTTYADEDVLAMENLLLTFTNVGGPVFKNATQAIVDMSTALGQDLNSSAQLVGRALQDPIRGMIQLRRSGITFTDSQKEMIKELMRAGKLQEAQGIILAELEKKFGGAAAAAKDTFGGAIKSMNNSLDDAQEVIGKALAPTIQEFVTGAIMPAVEWIKKIDGNTVKLVVGFGAAVAATFAVGKAIQAVSNMLKAGISPLQGVLMALAAIGAVIAVVNEGMARARTIHGELADAYMKEYLAIDGQVKSYNELKNKTNLTKKEKSDLIKVESALKTQLGESSAFIRDQSGKWIVNANSVNKYKKERLDLAVRELKAQIAVSTQENKHAKEREAYWPVYKALLTRVGTGQATVQEKLTATWLMGKYQFGMFASMAENELFVMRELSDTTEKLSNSKEQLTVLTTEGVAAAVEYKNAQDETTTSQLKNTAVTDEQIKAEEDLASIRRENALEFMTEQQREVAAVYDKMEIMRNAGATEYEVDQYYVSKIAEINKKYADKAAQAWADSVNKISDTVNAVTGAVGMAWGAIEGVWGQALQNEETELDNKYAADKARIEATITDETQKAAALAALDAEYDKKKRALQKKQWALDKASKISGAIMGTAQAVVSALAVFPPWVGIALAAVVGALGAVQIGMIAAEPMPAFAGGGMASPGLAMVGEKGPEIVRFERPAQVYTAEETSEMLAGAGGRGAIDVRQPLIIQIDSSPIYRGLLLASRDRIAMIDGRAVV